MPTHAELAARSGVGEPGCPTCGGIGYVRYDVPLADPRFGKIFKCPDCPDRAGREAREKVYRDKLERIGDASFVAPEWTFESFKLYHGAHKTIAAAYYGAMVYAEDPHGWLVFHGPPGTGKSHLCSAIANRLVAQRRMVIAATAPDLLDFLRSGFDNHDYTQLLRMTQTCDLLILDDLGVEHETDWGYEKLYQIINYRYNRIMPTVFSTNLVDLAGIEERLRSRMSDRQHSQMFGMTGEDYRKRKEPR